MRQNLTQTKLQTEHDNGLRSRLGKQLHSLNIVGIQADAETRMSQVKK